MLFRSDAAAYLAQGYRVVAFEADPGLAAAGRKRFADAIAAGRLTIVEGAIGPGDGPVLRFYRHPGHTHFGTIDAGWAERNRALGWESEAVDVARVDFAAELARHGTPKYLKIDIEGADRLVLEALLESEARPAFVSIESSKTSFAALRAEFDLLGRLGYDRFKLAQQEGIGATELTVTSAAGTPMRLRHEDGGSGQWGDDLPGRWLGAASALLAYRAVFLRYRLFGDFGILARLVGGKRLSWVSWRLGVVLAGWHDTHARHRSAVN